MASRFSKKQIVLIAVLATILLTLAGFGAYQAFFAGPRKAPVTAAQIELERARLERERLEQGERERAAEEAARKAEEESRLVPLPEIKDDSSTVAKHSLAPQGRLAGKTIVIDPGHQAKGNSAQEPIGPGASETKAKVAGGTSGVATKRPESQVTLEVSLKLRDALVAQGATVIMVRETQEVDISNAERAAVANNANASLFIRLHCDGAANSSANGISTLVPAQNQWTAPIVASSKQAGECVQTALITATGAKNLGVKPRADLSGFNYCKVPSVLVEMGFMTNPDEDRRLSDPNYQAKLVQGLVNGSIAYLNP